jgi:hypothetical protein
MSLTRWLETQEVITEQRIAKGEHTQKSDTLWIMENAASLTGPNVPIQTVNKVALDLVKMYSRV